MEHRRPEGLSAGWFCERCGLPSSMMGHGDTCEPNPRLVAAVRQLNGPNWKAVPAFGQKSPLPEHRHRLIVDLGRLAPHRATELMDRLVGELDVRLFKLGRRTLLNHGGWAFAATIPHIGDLMLDLKIWDTPDTVREDVIAAFQLGARFVTVHHDCVAPARDAYTKHFGEVNPLMTPHRLLAVGNLTSAPVTANMVVDSIIMTDGAVVPACDLKSMRRRFPHAILITPGIRPVDNTGDYIESDDHDRAHGIASPTEAIRAGADYLVVGRPIIRAIDPVAAAKGIVEEIRSAI